MSDRKSRLADGEDDDLEIAAPEDFEVQRDDDGEILPVRQRVPGTDKAIAVRPLPPGAFAEWLPVLQGDDEDSEKQAEVMREFVTAPEEIATADASFVEEGMRGGWLSGVLQAIRNSSGYEVFREVRQERMREGAAVMEQLDADQMTDLVRDFSDSASENGTS